MKYLFFTILTLLSLMVYIVEIILIILNVKVSLTLIIITAIITGIAFIGKEIIGLIDKPKPWKEI